MTTFFQGGQYVFERLSTGWTILGIGKTPALKGPFLFFLRKEANFTGKAQPKSVRGPKLRASARLMNLIERALQLDPLTKQMVLDAMEYSVQATMDGKSTHEILQAVRSQLNG